MERNDLFRMIEEVMTEDNSPRFDYDLSCRTVNIVSLALLEFPKAPVADAVIAVFPEILKGFEELRDSHSRETLASVIATIHEFLDDDVLSEAVDERMEAALPVLGILLTQHAAHHGFDLYEDYENWKRGNRPDFAIHVHKEASEHHIDLTDTLQSFYGKPDHHQDEHTG